MTIPDSKHLEAVAESSTKTAFRTISAIPEGYVLVPIAELRDFSDTIGNLIAEVDDPGTGALSAHHRIRALLSAAPTPPVIFDGWWCPTCKAEVSPEAVTFEERHEVCGTYLAGAPTPPARDEEDGNS